MSLRELFYDILHVNKPIPIEQPEEEYVEDMTFQDNTWFWRQLEKRDKRTYFPKNRRDYVLDANGDDSNGEIFRLGVEIMAELCKGRTTLTTLKAYGTPSKKKCSVLPRPFPERYHRFLQKVDPAASAYAKSQSELAILSIGFNCNAYFAYSEIREPNLGFEDGICFYLFSENNAPSSAEKAQMLAETNQAEMAMYFHAWPDELHFDFDPENVDVNKIWAVIERICKKHNLIVTRVTEDA